MSRHDYMLVAGYEQQFNESLRYWRTRFVVIPTLEPPTYSGTISVGGGSRFVRSNSEHFHTGIRIVPEIRDPDRLCMYSRSQHPLHAGVLWASRQWDAAEQLPSGRRERVFHPPPETEHHDNPSKNDMAWPCRGSICASKATRPDSVPIESDIIGEEPSSRLNNTCASCTNHILGAMRCGISPPSYNRIRNLPSSCILNSARDRQRGASSLTSKNGRRGDRRLRGGERDDNHIRQRRVKRRGVRRDRGDRKKPRITVQH